MREQHQVSSAALSMSFLRYLSGSRSDISDICKGAWGTAVLSKETAGSSLPQSALKCCEILLFWTASTGARRDVTAGHYRCLNHTWFRPREPAKHVLFCPSLCLSVSPSSALPCTFFSCACVPTQNFNKTSNEG